MLVLVWIPIIAVGCGGASALPTAAKTQEPPKKAVACGDIMDDGAFVGKVKATGISCEEALYVVEIVSGVRSGATCERQLVCLHRNSYGRVDRVSYRAGYNGPKHTFSSYYREMGYESGAHILVNGKMRITWESGA